MGYQSTSKATHSEAQILEALQALTNCDFSSVCAAVHHFEVSYNTLCRRMNGGISQHQAQESRQILSNAEEKTLVQWITCYSFTGSPMTNPLLKKLTELVHQEHIQRVSESKAIAKTITLISRE
jgi:hypothetical protein